MPLSARHKATTAPPCYGTGSLLLQQQPRAEEDLARRTTVSDSEIAQNKRAIDRFNQARNDATERVDEILLTELGLVDAASDAPVSKVPTNACLNSEPAASIIDRMPIRALIIHAMRVELDERPDFFNLRR